MALTTMEQDQREQVRTALDLLGLALTAHDHQWTPEERRAYERAQRLLGA